MTKFHPGMAVFAFVAFAMSVPADAHASNIKSFDNRGSSRDSNSGWQGEDDNGDSYGKGIQKLISQNSDSDRSRNSWSNDDDDHGKSRNDNDKQSWSNSVPASYGKFSYAGWSGKDDGKSKNWSLRDGKAGDSDDGHWRSYHKVEDILFDPHDHKDRDHDRDDWKFTDDDHHWHDHNKDCGDPLATPLPPAGWLFGGALVGLLSLAQYRRRA